MYTCVLAYLGVANKHSPLNRLRFLYLNSDLITSASQLIIAKKALTTHVKRESGECRAIMATVSAC